MKRSAGWFAVVVGCGLAGCGKPAAAPPITVSWAPGVVYRPAPAPSARGLLDRRGLIHAHSVHSHDACDGHPRDATGVYDSQCADDFRRDLCASKHDFVFLSDHRDSFSGTDFPDALLYRQDLGDSLVTHEAGPTANRLACEDGTAPLIMAGAETPQMMPVGLERHAPTRGEFYGSDDPQAPLQVKQLGGVALVAHTEGWTPEQLVAMPLDGFEMFNLHRNTLKNAGIAADLVLGKIEKGDFEGLPVPDAFLTAFTIDDDVYMQTWGTTLARGVKRVTTMGTDCHRNTFPQPMQDGERIDSYRRMMSAFSNHLLIRPQSDGSFDDRDLKDALRSGRLYGTFDFLGVPEGFDYVADVGGSTHEMGESVSLAQKVTLKVSVPHVRSLDTAMTAPAITTHIWRAREGGWDEVTASTEQTLSLTVTTPGVYRVEVRITPSHLRPFIGKRGDFIRAERPWVYSNPIYVEP